MGEESGQEMVGEGFQGETAGGRTHTRVGVAEEVKYLTKTQVSEAISPQVVTRILSN